ncbi:MAG: hypothetical protein AB8B79_15750 [Granulosicoccus sp.]
MTNRYRQSGYALLLMLLALAAGSTWWLIDVSRTLVTLKSHAGFTPNDQRAMIQARQSLLSYASLYPFLYGPTGSGPGHLPCPDTDTDTDTDTHSQNGSGATHPFSGDSPNPPCGSTTYIQAALPRHISLPGKRYSFHSEPFQRFLYSVYSHVVNNPVNRIVNPSFLSSNEDMHAVAATIEYQTGVSQDPDGPELTARISNAALLEVVKPAVAAWVLDIVERSALGLCRATYPENHFHRNGGGRESVALRDLKSNDPNHFSAWSQECQALIELAQTCANSVDKSIDRSTIERSILLLVVDQVPLGDTCADIDLQHSTIESVAISRHWFFRNLWYEWMHVEHKPECYSGLIKCSLVYSIEPASDRREAGSNQLNFYWRLVS